MDERLHARLIEKINQLKALLEKFSSSDILNMLAMELRKQSFPDLDTPALVSPAKQSYYLIGLLQQTKEPPEPQSLNKPMVSELVSCLNEIFQIYAEMFWPTPDEEDDLSEGWHRCREVAMPAFLHYFNNSVMASVEQISDRIIGCLSPFDEEVVNCLGISIQDCLDICREISRVLQEKLDKFYQDAEKEKELRLGLLNVAKAEGWSEERLKEETQKSEYAVFIPQFIEQMNGLFSFSHDDLAVPSETLEKFFACFSIERGSGGEFRYITEKNPAELSPLVKIEDGRYFCPLMNALYIALLKKFEEIVLESSGREKFLHHRDTLLEKSGASLFLDILDEEARSYSGLFETEDLHFEHDSIIISGRNLFIVEAKASPPIEPFRDPERAYTRIKRHFRSDRGIQKAFDQAERLRRRLNEEGSVPLYDSDSKLCLTLRRVDFDNIFPICFTRDDYGPLGTNLNLLLEKDPSTPYPWVVNEFDLEALVQAYKHLGMNEQDFVSYLNDRVRLHGKLMGNDELEYAGYSIKHGGFSEVIECEADLIFLAPDYSDIFDEIYLAERSGETVEVEVARPVLQDARTKLIVNSENEKRKGSRNKDSKKNKRKRRNILQKKSRRRNRKNKK